MNVFDKFSKEEMIELLENSISITDVLRKVHLSTSGGGSRTSLQKTCRELGIFDLYNITRNQGKHSYKTESHPTLPIEKMTVEGSSTSRGTLKRTLLKTGLIKNECSSCGLAENWNGKTITMVLDHINGISNDNRLKNLRMLCPNCNSQQETFAGRNTKKKKKCRFCKKEYCGESVFCSAECRKNGLKRESKRVFTVSKDELSRLVWEMPMTEISKLFKVSDKSIAARCLLLKIEMPPRGYFAKKENRVCLRGMV